MTARWKIRFAAAIRTAGVLGSIGASDLGYGCREPCGTSGPGGGGIGR